MYIIRDLCIHMHNTMIRLVMIIERNFWIGNHIWSRKKNIQSLAFARIMETIITSPNGSVKNPLLDPITID